MYIFTDSKLKASIISGLAVDSSKGNSKIVIKDVKLENSSH